MFRHLNSGLPAATLFMALIFANSGVAQDCEALKLASATEAVKALDHGDIRTAGCSRAAFQLIVHLPQEQAIPVLIRHLGFQRPASNEPHGAISRCPAVDALYDIGLAAEPALIDFITQDENEGSIERANALEALALIRHGDVVPTIKLIRERSASLAGTPAASRLNSAERYMLKKFCTGKRLKKCEQRLHESESDN